VPIRIQQLPGQLQRGLAPLYLIAGPEMLLVQESRDRVFAAAREQGFVERDLLQAGKDFDWQSLADAGVAPSLFSSRRIIDLRLPTGKPGREGAKALTDWADNPDPDTLLVISCEQWDKSSRSSKWAAALDKAGIRIDIWPVKPEEMPGWIRARLEAVGLQPDRDAIMMLSERLEGNLLAARQEIEKLLLLKGPGPLTAADVERSVADSAQFDSFLLAERMFSGQAAEGLRIAAGLRRTGVAIQLITGALYREFGVLEAYRMARAAGENEKSVFRRLNVWPARQGPVRSAASRLNRKRLNDAFQALSLIDRQSKGMAPGDEWHSLDHLVCAVCGA
jgi:DNA polymerase-3 subunit delta